MASGSAILVAMWLGAVGPAVQTWSGTAPTGSCVGYRVYIDVAGTGTYYCNNGTWATVAGGGGGYSVIQDEGVALTARTTIDFAGAGVTCSDSGGTKTLCTIPGGAGSPGAPVNSVQYNSAGSFAGSANLTFASPTLTFGAGSGSDAIKFSNAGARLTLSSLGGLDYFYSSGSSIVTPGTLTALRFIATTSSAGVAGLSLTTGALLDIGTGGNDHFYSDGANIITPGSLTATGGFIGNASTASALFANGTNCAAGQTALGVDASGNSEGCYTLSLSQLGNPTGDKTFTYPSGAKTLWEFSGGTDYAFSIHGTGAFTGSGDLVHFHMQGTTVDANADVLHIEAEDADAVGLRIANNSGSPTTTQSITASGKANFGGTVTAPTFVGALTGNASTASILATAGTTSQYWRGDNTWATPPGGGGGSPAGSTGQVQFNDAGSFAASVDLSHSTTNRTTYVGIGVENERQATHPASPAAGRLKWTAFGHHGTNSPATPQIVDGQTSLEYHPLPMSLAIDDRWGCAMPAGFSSTTINSTGGTTAAATGTAAAVAWAVTDERTRHPFIQYPTTAAVNLNAGVRANADLVWRGNAADIGGFYVWGTMNIVTANAGQRVFMGLKDATAVLTATADPNAALDTVYFGCNAADTNLSICSNDATTTATCTTLGANFPCKTANVAYDWAFWAAPNASSINYYIRRLVNGSTAEGTVSTDLPRNTVALGWDMNINSGTSAAITTMQFGGACFIGNP